MKGRFIACLGLFFLVLSTASNASEAVNNEAYYQVLVEIFFNAILSLALLAGLCGLLWLSVVTLKTFVNPTMLQQSGNKPITITRILGGLAVVSIFWAPLESVKLFTDLTGVGKDGICLTVDVNVSHISWANSASQCISYAEGRFSDLAEYSNDEHIRSANVGLWLSIVQLISLGFFLSSAWMLLLHMIGVREVKMSVGASLFAMTMSTVTMSAPYFIDYIEDFRGKQNVVLES